MGRWGDNSRGIGARRPLCLMEVLGVRRTILTVCIAMFCAAVVGASYSGYRLYHHLRMLHLLAVPGPPSPNSLLLGNTPDSPEGHAITIHLKYLLCAWGLFTLLVGVILVLLVKTFNRNRD